MIHAPDVGQTVGIIPTGAQTTTAHARRMPSLGRFSDAAVTDYLPGPRSTGKTVHRSEDTDVGHADAMVKLAVPAWEQGDTSTAAQWLERAAEAMRSNRK